MNNIINETFSKHLTLLQNKLMNEDVGENPNTFDVLLNSQPAGTVVETITVNSIDDLRRLSKKYDNSDLLISFDQQHIRVGDTPYWD